MKRKASAKEASLLELKTHTENQKLLNLHHLFFLEGGEVFYLLRF
jgi:hypothetical protein